ncbi:MAG TPA: hypothetical protein VNF75_05740 [Candidatus Dormibacteraeota bacterium]|nr:hypothetical protein [Candidatus Dormibacteraeota bacterium]
MTPLTTEAYPYAPLGVFQIRNPLDSIRLCRNFIAHKCEGTFGELNGTAATGLQDLREYLRAKRDGVELFSEWKDGCLAIANAAAW